jgi:lipopolysaccharide biosynthesis regulator YciM
LATAPKAEWRNAEEAERLALQVCQATQYRMAEPMDTLAAALAAKGDFVQAVSILERALPMAETELPASVLAEVKKRLALYRSGRPYTAP